MQVKSFIDIVSTHSALAEATVADLYTMRYIESHEPEYYGCEIYGCQISGRTREEWDVEVGLQSKVESFRNKAFEQLNGKTNLVIVDREREKIFTNIQGNPFFEQLATEVGFDEERNFQLKIIGEKCSLEKILKKAFPDPVPKEEKADESGCVVA